jgi:hypothetical protein
VEELKFPQLLDGGGNFNSTGPAGGSGIIVLRYSALLSISGGTGLTSTTTITSNGVEKVTTITAGTGTFTFN